MPVYSVWVCDRCGRRHEGEELAAGWCDLTAWHGVPEPHNDHTESIDDFTFYLCPDCAPPTIKRLRDWVSKP